MFSKRFSKIWDKVDDVFEAATEVFDDLAEGRFESEDGTIEIKVVNGHATIKGKVKSLTVNGAKVALPMEGKSNG